MKKLLQLAERFLILAEYKKAEEVLREVIDIDSYNPEGYYLLGEALCKQRFFEEALVMLNKANTLLPSHPRILHLLGWTTFMDGDAEEGRRLLKKALQSLPSDVSILCDLAVLENQQGNGEEAEKYAAEAFRLEPENSMAREVFQVVVAFDNLRQRLNKKSADVDELQSSDAKINEKAKRKYD